MRYARVKGRRCLWRHLTAAGAADLQAACDKFTPIKIGGGDHPVFRPARFIIHTAGPVYRDGKRRGALLRACYINSLKRALENRCQSVAFRDLQRHLRLP